MKHDWKHKDSFAVVFVHFLSIQIYIVFNYCRCCCAWCFYFKKFLNFPNNKSVMTKINENCSEYSFATSHLFLFCELLHVSISLFFVHCTLVVVRCYLKFYEIKLRVMLQLLTKEEKFSEWCGYLRQLRRI